MEHLPPAYDPRIERFSVYLAAKAPPGKLPGRQHIDPHEITDLLPYLMLYDVVPQASDDPRYRTRLIGTHAAELLGTGATGRFIDEILPAVRGAEIIGHYNQILIAKQPHYFEGTLTNIGREHIRFQRAGFPLARNGENVDMLVLIMIGFDTREVGRST